MPAARAVLGPSHYTGAWKVAYADFTTAMMALFLILWILSSASREQKESIANYFRSDGPLRDGGASVGGGALHGGSGVLSQISNDVVAVDVRRLERTGQALRERLRGDAGLAGVAEQVQISMGEEGLVIEISDDRDDALFAVGSAAMDPRLARVLDDIAGTLAPLPNALRIEGHTDARRYPAGAAYSNWELSADRANATRHRLEGRGLSSERFESVVGCGERYLKYPTDPQAPGNRRISLTVLRDDDAVGEARPGDGSSPAPPAL